MENRVSELAQYTRNAALQILNNSSEVDFENEFDHYHVCNMPMKPSSSYSSMVRA